MMDLKSDLIRKTLVVSNSETFKKHIEDSTLSSLTLSHFTRIQENLCLTAHQSPDKCTTLVLWKKDTESSIADFFAESESTWIRTHDHVFASQITCMTTFGLKAWIGLEDGEVCQVNLESWTIQTRDARLPLSKSVAVKTEADTFEDLFGESEDQEMVEESATKVTPHVSRPPVVYLAASPNHISVISAHGIGQSVTTLEFNTFLEKTDLNCGFQYRKKINRIASAIVGTLHIQCMLSLLNGIHQRDLAELISHLSKNIPCLGDFLNPSGSLTI